MITTVIGAYPKPSFLNLPDWFNAKGGTDTKYPTKNYINSIKSMGHEVESIFLKATKEIIDDQVQSGIDIITDGEVRRENYIHYQCRHIEGIDFSKLTNKALRDDAYKANLPTIVMPINAREPFLYKDSTYGKHETTDYMSRRY